MLKILLSLFIYILFSAQLYSESDYCESPEVIIDTMLKSSCVSRQQSEELIKVREDVNSILYLLGLYERIYQSNPVFAEEVNEATQNNLFNLKLREDISEETRDIVVSEIIEPVIESYDPNPAYICYSK